MTYEIVDGLTDPDLINSCKDSYRGRVSLSSVGKWSGRPRNILLAKISKDLLDCERINSSFISKGGGGKPSIFIVLNDKFDEFFSDKGGISGFTDWIDDFSNHQNPNYKIIERKIPTLGATQKVVEEVLNHQQKLKTLDYTQEELNNLFTYLFTNTIIKSGGASRLITALSKIAEGYTAKYEEQVLDIDPDTNQVIKKRVYKKTQIYPPNMEAMKFVLKDVMGFGKVAHNPQALEGSFKKLNALMKNRMKEVHKFTEQGKENLAEIAEFEVQENMPKQKNIDLDSLKTTYLSAGE